MSKGIGDRIAQLTILIEDLDVLCLKHCDLNDLIGQQAESDLHDAINERSRLLSEYREGKR